PIDFLAEATRFLGALLDAPPTAFWRNAPYAVALSFDVDDFRDGQLIRALEFVSRWTIKQATFLVMASGDEELCPLDTRYDCTSAELQFLWEADTEIGLLSSYLAHDRPDYLRKQRQRLREVSGQPINGNRNAFGRCAFPRSWAHQLREGFTYDASLAYPDLPGTRNGTFLPTFVPDPDGFDSYLAVVP